MATRHAPAAQIDLQPPPFLFRFLFLAMPYSRAPPSSRPRLNACCALLRGTLLSKWILPFSASCETFFRRPHLKYCLSYLLAYRGRLLLVTSSLLPFLDVRSVFYSALEAATFLSFLLIVAYDTLIDDASFFALAPLPPPQIALTGRPVL